MTAGIIRSTSPTFAYDVGHTATTPTAYTRTDAARGDRNPASESRSRTSSIASRRAAKGIKSIDPASVRFSQSSIRGTFDGHGTIDDLAEGL